MDDAADPTRSNLQPGLLALGALFVLIGAAVFLTLWLQSPDSERATPPFKDYGTNERLDPAEPSLIWSIAAGGSLALGAALIGIGLNRWRGTGRSIRGA